MSKSSNGIAVIRSGQQLPMSRKLALTLSLSVPAIMAQLSNIVMQYIDAAMVGRLGENAAAAIGLIATTTWLFFGLLNASATGFSVQVAHLLGASRRDEANGVLRQSFTSLLVYSCAIAAIGAAISPWLPVWLGGAPDITSDSSSYFLIFALALPIQQLNYLAASMLRCSGNMAVPGILNVVMCLLDVIFNALLIFPSRTVTLLGSEFHVWGAGLGVTGAALGTALAVLVCLIFMLLYLCRRRGELRLPGPAKDFRLKKPVFIKAVRIGWPIAVERIIFCTAAILITVIVAPLGTAAIAANAFSVTIESLCYMPGFGIADAATALVGQSLGAGRRDLARSFGHLTTGVGVVVMSAGGLLMYVFAPEMIGLMTHVEAVRDLSTVVLRIEAFCEPLYAVSIVAYGVFVGAGDTVRPCSFNLVSMWAVCLPLAYLLANYTGLGLAGVWLAMSIELSVRGLLFLIWLLRGRWVNNKVITQPLEQQIDITNENEIVNTYEL